MRNVPPATTIWAHDASSTHAAFVVEQASRLRIGQQDGPVSAAAIG